MGVPCPTEIWPEGVIRVARREDCTCDHVSPTLGHCDRPIEPGDHYFDCGARDEQSPNPFCGFYRYCLGAGHAGVPSAEAAAGAIAAAQDEKERRQRD